MIALMLCICEGIFSFGHRQRGLILYIKGKAADILKHQALPVVWFRNLTGDAVAT